MPDLLQVATDCQRFGAQGITVHPRPDQRHVRYDDVLALRPLVTTEFNIEGYPSEDFLRLVEKVRPEQVTLVPDPPGVLTSNAGWKVSENLAFLSETVLRLKSSGVRVSLFVDPIPSEVEAAASVKTDRIELYTEAYAAGFEKNRQDAVAPYVLTARAAADCHLGINAGHDLNARNLAFFAQKVHGLLEVSIGHALICDALYWGLENTIQMYRRQLIRE